MDDTIRTQIAENLRFYSDARFKQLTLFLAWITLIAGGLFQFSENQLAKDLGLQQALPVCAMLVTAVFWVLEIRASLYWRAHRDALRELWPRPPGDFWHWLNATNAMFVLYAGSFAVWFAVALKLRAGQAILWPAGLLGLVVFVFGVQSYIRYRKEGSTLKRAKD